MIHSRFLRIVVALAAACFAAFMSTLLGTGTVEERAVGTGVCVLAALLSLGMLLGARGRPVLRVVAGVAGAAYLVYAAAEVALLLSGQRQERWLMDPSAVTGLLGLLVWGIPLSVYALTGRSPRAHSAAEAAAARAAQPLTDERILAAVRAAGVELPATIILWLRVGLPTHDHARSVGRVAEQNGWRAEASSDLGSEAQDACDPSCSMARLGTFTDRMLLQALAETREIAARYGGVLEAWDVYPYEPEDPSPVLE